jgi:hypothetical protein
MKKQADIRVAGTKLTGTGRLRDLLELRDAGADMVYDFVDGGLCSTYTSPQLFLPHIKGLLRHINSFDPAVIVAELGGDVIEANVPVLLKDEEIRGCILAVLIVGNDVVGLKAVHTYLQEWGVTAPCYVVCPMVQNSYSNRSRIDQWLGVPSFDLLNNIDELDETANQLIRLLHGSRALDQA